MKIFDVDCETRARLAECWKIVICDFLWCINEELCTPDGKLRIGDEYDDYDGEKGENLQTRLLRCLGTLVCSASRCIPEALCPPQEVPCLPPNATYLPCDFAVEEES